MSILNDDINQLERFLDVGANDLIQVLTTVIVIGGIFVVVTPSVAWMALLPVSGDLRLGGSAQAGAALHGRARAEGISTASFPTT